MDFAFPILDSENCLSPIQAYDEFIEEQKEKFDENQKQESEAHDNPAETC